MNEPWRPKDGEQYFALTPVPDKRGVVVWCYKWRGSYHDQMMYKIGNCYPKSKIAESHLLEWYEFFDSDEQVNVFGGNCQTIAPITYGKWILERLPDGSPYCYHCSICDEDFHHIGVHVASHYCPNCGSVMQTHPIIEYKRLCKTTEE